MLNLDLNALFLLIRTVQLRQNVFRRGTTICMYLFVVFQNPLIRVVTPDIGYVMSIVCLRSSVHNYSLKLIPGLLKIEERIKK